VLGENAGEIAVTSHEYYRLERQGKLYQRARMIEVEDCSCFDFATSAAQIAEAKARFRAALMMLDLQFDSTGVSDLFEVILRAHNRQGAFDLCGEWHACAQLASQADSAELPTSEQTVTLVGRVEILVERIQAFFKQEGILPDHFRG
jgi:hypothetical protein